MYGGTILRACAAVQCFESSTGPVAVAVEAPYYTLWNRQFLLARTSSTTCLTAVTTDSGDSAMSWCASTITC